MTSRIATFSEKGDIGEVIGQSWDRLFPVDDADRGRMGRRGESRPTANDVKRLPDIVEMIGQTWDRLFPVDDSDRARILPKPRRPDPGLTLKDVKRLPAKDMSLFGRHPETDPIITVVCSYCNCVYLPHAFSRHVRLRHGDDSTQARNTLANVVLKSKCSKKVSPPKKPPKSAPTSPPESNDEDSSSRCRSETNFSSNVSCSLRTAAIPSQSIRRHDVSAKSLSMSNLNVKVSKKTSPPKKSSKFSSASPPELTEESKDLRKSSKSKKCTSPIPPELEPMLPTSRRLVLAATGPPELLPVELPKRNSKKKIDRKADKVYDPNKHCGVINDTGKPCLRSILCKVHLVAHKRAVQNRAMPYDALKKLLMSQNDEDKRPKIEATPALIIPKKESPSMCVLTTTNSEVCPEQISINQVEPPAKRFKTEEVENEQYPLSSDWMAFIEATLKDQEKNELPNPDIPLSMLRAESVPRPEPLVRWSLQATQLPQKSFSPPHFPLDNIPWHPSHPRPLATNTFGCRLIGGLLSKTKKLEAVRKQLHSLWSSQSQGSFSDSSLLPGFSVKPNSSTLLKKNLVSPSASRRKKTGSGSEVIPGLLQRSNQPTTNGVPLRVFQGNIQQPTYFQLNVCPSK